MIPSGDAAEQMVRLSLEGAEVAVRLTGAAAKEIALFLVTALKKSDKNLKTKGKARLTSMLKSGKALEIFSIKERDLARFARGAKQYGIVYTVLRNKKGSPDGLCDVMVRADDAPKISRLIERFKFATVDKAKIESEIVAEKTGRESDGRTGEPAGTEPAAPDVADTERLLDDLLGPVEGKVEPETPAKTPEPAKPEPVKAEPVKPGKEPVDRPPFARSAPPPERPPSEPTSESGRKSESPLYLRPSVKEELREITASRRKKEPNEPKRLNTDKTKTSPTGTTHKQPQSRKKPKKSKGGR